MRAGGKKEYNQRYYLLRKARRVTNCKAGIESELKLNCDDAFYIILITGVPEIWEEKKDIFVIILTSLYMNLQFKKGHKAFLVIPCCILFMYFPFGKPKSLGFRLM